MRGSKNVTGYVKSMYNVTKYVNRRTTLTRHNTFMVTINTPYSSHMFVISTITYTFITTQRDTIHSLT
ncbi:hypothetical protein MtrunA17_Chr5g0411831 [Medicago truncatula]|uniref:Uncharacterized protein n=1 Tax=Medicago truncatula TaxID=3880 RepID=A0A396HSJ5_MEDTR|nr:hypothetical protein MtrunA17_Chr5g0411831 [Medicago truncatula]